METGQEFGSQQTCALCRPSVYYEMKTSQMALRCIQEGTHLDYSFSMCNGKDLLINVGALGHP